MTASEMPPVVGVLAPDELDLIAKEMELLEAAAS
jgi:hypothetical protein